MKNNHLTFHRNITIRGQQNATQFAAAPIKNSKWFNLTPLPDVRWGFEVKAESGIPEQNAKQS